MHDETTVAQAPGLFKFHYIAIKHVLYLNYKV
jgi:hypothetical protein